ncbi:MAG: hypothetical protein H7096_05890, partial [Flavobacterium sp.]|nr:hypothetical protein [Pedobacter sp.]
KENIFCITSKNNGTTFSEPELVGQIVGMHLGNTRGPQIASSKKFSMITAIDNKGKIHSYRLNHLSNTWKKTAQVNDIKGSAVEGLMALTADNEDNFYATWLDIRIEEKNNIYFSSINEEATAWGKNHLVYKSPDEHVCECCKPNIAFSNNKLVISFRNWLLGSRDIYYAISSDMGKNFSAPVKSGKGTWQLNACPMDGGGLAINESGVVSAAWRRNSDIFYSSGNKPERKLSVGRDVSLSQNKLNTVVAWQDKNKVQVLQFNTQKVTDLGNGTSPKVYVLPNGKTICMWEDDKIIRFKII